IQDVACRACDRGAADYDIRQTFTANSVYQVPFARGRWYGGWDLSGIFTARSGRPLSVVVSRASSAVPSGQTQVQRANYVGVVSPYAAGKGPDSWLNPAAFAAPANGTYGNAGRNAFRGPGLWQADLGVAKRIRLAQHASLDFRTEIFNLFNRAQYGNPVANISTSTFGRILSTANDGATGTGTSRQLQFMLRFSF
ncbi:MAG: TonB-dependent receptor, partial [Longimicrobiales bacterium]